MTGSLFISYSHADTPAMQRVKRHLEGMLHGRCKVWTDEDIATGNTWQDTLLGQLRQAAAGLVLVSPDYLVSPWCRRELASLAEARRLGRLSALYWLLVAPCGWRWTELKALQAVQEPSHRALTDVPEGPARDDHLLRCCETVATQLLPLLDKEDEVVAAVRAILLRSEFGAQITPISRIADGDFSIVARGVDGEGNDVVIKVLTNTPLHRMRELFFKVSSACAGLHLPSVLQTEHVFTVGQGHEQRIVILGELARGRPLADALREDAANPAAKRHFGADNVRVVLRRVAEALEALHGLPPVPWGGGAPYRHLMGPLVPANLYYDPLSMRPQISLVGVTNFLWHFFDATTFRRIVDPSAGLYRLPEKDAGGLPDVRADQYHLGVLALEMMERRPLFAGPEGTPPVDPLRVLAEAPWAARHAQFAKLLARLLAPDPAARFQGDPEELAAGDESLAARAPMREVLRHLRELESEQRALAKYAYRRVVTPPWGGSDAASDFSHAFYDAFFARSPAMRAVFEHARRARTGPGGDGGPIPDELHHRKLLDGLKAVLNFAPGGEPSAIDTLAGAHAGFALDAQAYEDFEATFLQTLDTALAAAGEDETARHEIAAAWRSLFAPVRAEMLAIAARRCGRA